MNNNFYWGNIFSLVLVAFIIVLFVLFFIKKRSIKLLIIYVSTGLFVAGVNILGWFFEGFETAEHISDLIMFTFIVIAIIVYQNDFKVVFSRLSTARKTSNVFASDEELQTAIEEIVKATQVLSKTRIGALVVVVPSQISHHIIDSGIRMDALVSAQLLQSIFNTHAPIHDGAVIIKGNKILSSGCFLPLSNSANIAKELGTRHRAGVGITEETDNLSIIVSEETGIISVAKDGRLSRYITPERLSDILHETFGVTITTTRTSNIRKLF
ncbi:MAG: diadenylate cyclase [Clostridia bacterium]